MQVSSIGTRLLAIAAAAFLLRLTVRLHSGEADFWQNGYSFLFELAHNFAAGRGLAFDGGPPTTSRVPVYPLFLAAVTFGRHAFVPICRGAVVDWRGHGLLRWDVGGMVWARWAW